MSQSENKNVLILRMKLVILTILALALTPRGQASLLKNVTNSVFHDKGKGILPLAFGDFNSDKLTDIVVTTQSKEKITVLLARFTTFSIGSSKYFDNLDKVRIELQVLH